MCLAWKMEIRAATWTRSTHQLPFAHPGRNFQFMPRARNWWSEGNNSMRSDITPITSTIPAKMKNSFLCSNFRVIVIGCQGSASSLSGPISRLQPPTPLCSFSQTFDRGREAHGFTRILVLRWPSPTFELPSFNKWVRLTASLTVALTVTLDHHTSIW